MNALATAKKFVVNNKTAIAVGVTAAICMTVARVIVRQHDDFLKEHDLYDIYYKTGE